MGDLNFSFSPPTNGPYNVGPGTWLHWCTFRPHLGSWVQMAARSAAPLLIPPSPAPPRPASAFAVDLIWCSSSWVCCPSLNWFSLPLRPHYGCQVLSCLLPSSLFLILQSFFDLVSSTYLGFRCGLSPPMSKCDPLKGYREPDLRQITSSESPGASFCSLEFTAPPGLPFLCAKDHFVSLAPGSKWFSAFLLKT